MKNLKKLEKENQEKHDKAMAKHHKVIRELKSELKEMTSRNFKTVKWIHSFDIGELADMETKQSVQDSINKGAQVFYCESKGQFIVIEVA